MQTEYQGLTMPVIGHIILPMSTSRPIASALGQSYGRFLEQRKRAFMAALTLQGQTQVSWAAKHRINQATVSRVLSGSSRSARIMGLIDREIARVAKAESAQEVA